MGVSLKAAAGGQRTQYKILRLELCEVIFFVFRIASVKIHKDAFLKLKVETYDHQENFLSVSSCCTKPKLGTLTVISSV